MAEEDGIVSVFSGIAGDGRIIRCCPDKQLVSVHDENAEGICRKGILIRIQRRIIEIAGNRMKAGSLIGRNENISAVDVMIGIRVFFPDLLQHCRIRMRVTDENDFHISIIADEGIPKHEYMV